MMINIMNTKYYVAGVALSLFLGLLSGCQKDFEDVRPTGNSLSLEQLQHANSVSPDRAQAGLSGMYGNMNLRSGFLAAFDPDGDYQGDFGYSSFACRLEHAGDGVVSTTKGYNWFAGNLTMRNFNDKRATQSIWAWYAFYKNILLSNSIIAQSKGSDDPIVKATLGEALAFRAWSYHQLIQLFQQTYVGHESDPGVPLVTEDTPANVIANNPRVEVSKVYDQILSDLSGAIAALEGAATPPKSRVSQATAYGLRARVYLVMNKWQEAAADAEKAIELFAKEGGRPYTIEEAGIPNFDDVATSPNAMWGIIITDQDPVTKSGIANFTSMFTSLCYGSGGYTSLVGTYKMINTRLWSKIPKTDIRRDWWSWESLVLAYKKDKKTGKYLLDKDGNKIPALISSTSPAIKRAWGDKVQEALILGKNAGGEVLSFTPLFPYSVVKFAPNNKDPYDPVNAVDFMLMRVEEMYYIVAEARAMAGDFAGGKAYLEQFVRQYRDPDFSSKAGDAKALQDEIYQQRRVEFWGEGISWFDRMRLKKGTDRIDVAAKDTGGYPELTRFNIPAEDPIFVLQIPSSEEQANKALFGHNNPVGVDPKDQI